MSNKNGSKGFSLLELGITLSIIAMLVSAIVAGKNVKTQLQLNQVVEDISKLSNAVKEFREIYGGYPGDLFDAEDKFGEANTASGSGNGGIQNGDIGSDDGSSGEVNEVTMFFDHLELSGLLTDSAVNQETPFKRGAYTVLKDNPEDRLTIQFAIAGTEAGILTTKQAFDIDTKYDDGDPSTGTILGLDGTGVTAGNECLSGGAYQLSVTDNTPCRLRFLID